MATQLITTDDLRELKMELLEEFKKLLNDSQGTKSIKWLRSGEVMELLSISPGTLQNLRINGTIPYTKIGGVLYYDADEINSVLKKHRVDNKFY
jgi:hypothetical protein